MTTHTTTQKETEMITATAATPTDRFAEGDEVAIYRRTTTSPYTGVQIDWYVAPAELAHDGPAAPAWGDPAGHAEQWTGWGLGTVRAVRQRTRDHILYEVTEGADYGTLTDYRTGEAIRPATADEHARSLAAGETGAIEDADGHAVYVEGGPES